MQGFIRSMDTIASGSGKGILRLHDASDLELLSQEGSPAVHELCQLDSGIRAMQTSTYPEEKYFAVGTSKGTVTVFEVKYLRQKKAFKYHIFRPHKEQVNDLKFIQKGDDFMLASLSGDGVFNVVCLKECIQLFKKAFGWDSISELANSPSTNTFLVLTRKSEVLKFNSSADGEYIRDLESCFCNDLDEAIKRTFLTEGNIDKQRACIEHVEGNEILALDKINILSIAAQLGQSQALAVACERHDMLFGVDGLSLVQICSKPRDSDCIQILMQKMIERNSYLNQDTLLHIIEKEESEVARQLLLRLQI